MTYANMALLENARRNLSLFVMVKANRISHAVGFGYTDKPVAPSSYSELIAAWRHSRKTGLALPVWSGASDNTIYTTPGANYAFRFWHDSIHALQQLEFNTIDEIIIGTEQVKAVQVEFGMYSLEAILMYSDTIAQSLYADANNGNFPDDQYAFVIGIANAFCKQYEFDGRAKLAA